MNKLKNILLIGMALLVLSSCEMIPATAKNNKEVSKVSEKQIIEALNKGSEKEKKEEEKDDDKEAEDKPIKVKMLFGGDILPHMPINDYARAYGKDGKLDYSRSLEDLKEFAKNYDFFMVNNEFSVNPNMKLSGYPTFNSSEDIYTALKDAGVDLMTTANNHSLDTGIEGLKTTLEALDRHQIDRVGTSMGDYTPYIIKELKGLNIAIFSYAESLNGLDGLLDTEDKKKMVNRLIPEKIEEDIKSVRDKVDFIVVYPHWGVEYSSYPEKYQIELARNMIDWGADMVIGNHPHVIQPMEKYKSKDGREGVINYSLGNLLSNQKSESFGGDYRVEQGLLVEAEIEKVGDEKAKIVSSKYHSTIVDRSYDDYGMLDKTYVVTPYIKNQNLMSKLDEGTQFLIEKAYEDNKKTVEGGIK